MAQFSGLISGKYKIIRLLYQQTDYAAVQAVDILDRQRPVCLLNIYEGEEVRKYAPVYHDLKDCPDFLDLFFEKEALVAVFRWHDEPAVDKVFFGDSEQTWKFRLEVLEGLFRLALRQYGYPPEIGCSAMLNRNLCISGGDKNFKVNYFVIPGTKKLSERELICLTGDQAKKILLPAVESKLEVRKFMMELEGGRWKDAVSLNSGWNDRKEAIIAEYEKWDQMGPLSRLATLFLNYFRFEKERKRSIYGQNE